MPDRKTTAFRRLTIYAGEASLVVSTDFMQESAERLLEALRANNIDPTGCLYRIAKKMEGAVVTAERLSQKKSSVDRSISERQQRGLQRKEPFRG